MTLREAGCLVVGALTVWMLLLHWVGSRTDELDEREAELDVWERSLGGREDRAARTGVTVSWLQAEITRLHNDLAAERNRQDASS